MVSRPCRRHIPRHSLHRHSLAALAATRPRATLTAAAAARAARRYAHWGTLVLLITAGVDGVKGLGYWDKGCALGGVAERACAPEHPTRRHTAPLTSHLEAPLAACAPQVDVV